MIQPILGITRISRRCEVDSESWTRLSKIYRSFSGDECRALRALVYATPVPVDDAVVEKFIELKLLRRDGEKIVVTPDGRRVGAWC
jgi:hypothetical protein